MLEMREAIDSGSVAAPETSAAPPRRITIAFDGACLGNPGRGGYGAILVNETTGAEKIVKGRDRATTNNKMELSAAIAGLNTLRPGAVVTMLGDSQYVIRGITEWMPGWKLRGWRAAGGKPVANIELWRLLEAAVARHETVAWTWVKGHAGHELNELVDRIARHEAARG